MSPILHLQFVLCCEKSTRPPFGRSAGNVWTSGLTAILVSLSIASIATAQWVDSFDSPNPRFRLWRDDAKAQLGKPPKLEPGTETIAVSFGPGSYVHLIHPIDRCAIIDDLHASLRILSAQKGIRIAFRVVFPRTSVPMTRDPVTALLFGTPSSGGGRWSESTISNVSHLFEEQLRVMRTRYGPAEDLRDAYIDAIVLDVYGLPGTHLIRIDDLLIEGMIPPSDDSELPVSPGAVTASSTMYEQLRKLQAEVPRWIQYQGESLDYLQSMGFNAVVSDRYDPAILSEQSIRTGLGVVIPPPDFIPSEGESGKFKHVRGWLLGFAMNQSGLDGTRNRAARVMRYPPSIVRPMIGEAMESFGSYSRLSDWLAVPMPLATSVRSSMESASIMQSDLRPIAGRSLPLTSLATQLPTDWILQRGTASNALAKDWRLPDYDFLQNRLQVYRSMMQGSRGWMFRSSSSLDAGDITAEARAKGYTAINQEIALLMPWILASQSSWRAIPIETKGYSAAILETAPSQLVLIVASGPMDQICSVAPKAERLQFTIPLAGQPRQVFRITHGQLEILRPQATPRGLLITIDRPALVEQVVSVVDNQPVAYLRDQLGQMAPSFVEARIDMAEQVIEEAQLSLVAQRFPSTHPDWEAVRRAQGMLRNAGQFLGRSNFPQALAAADGAMQEAQWVVRKHWERAVQPFPTFQSSPLIASPLSLSLHWEMDRILRNRLWESKRIPGVPLTTQTEWESSGWQIDRRLVDSIDSRCDVVRVPNESITCMYMTAQSLTQQPIASGYAGASMRVSSPPIDIPQGAFVHLRGMVKIDSPANETQSGLLVSDNQAGEALGQLISSADPSSETWRPFELFRFMSQSNGLQLHFETRGKVQAFVKDLQVEMIIPTPAPNLPTRTE